MIELRNLTLPLARDYHPQKRQTLSLCLERGGYYWLFGPPESGKTSLLEILALRRRPTSGQLIMSGFNLTEKPDGKTITLLRTRTGYVADQPEFIEDWSLFDNIALPLRLNRYDRKTILRDTMSILKWLSLDDKAQSLPVELSHTERLKLAIARALIARPALLLIDKLAFALNSALRDKLLILLRDMASTKKTTIIAATDIKELTTALPAPLITLPCPPPEAWKT